MESTAGSHVIQLRSASLRQGTSGLKCCLGGMEQNLLLQGVFRGRIAVYTGCSCSS